MNKRYFLKLSKLFLIASFSAVVLSSCSSSSKSKNNEGAEDGSASGLSDQDLALENARKDGGRYQGGNIPVPKEGGKFPDIFFDYDSAVVKQEYQEIVQSNAKLLKSDPSLQMEIEGHCDKRGTAEYNLALGEERAKSVAAMMVKFGASASQLSTISYGEEIPLDPADNDAAYAKNRRAHFAVFRKKAK